MKESKREVIGSMKTMARQGDVLVIHETYNKLRPETKERLFGKKATKTLTQQQDFTKENRVTLALGEVTGHAHEIQNPKVQLKYSNDIQDTLKALALEEPSPVVHEEHGGIVIPEGDSRVLIQSQWSMSKLQRAAD